MSNVKVAEIPSLDTPPEVRLRKIPATVNEVGLSIITRAVVLRLASQANVQPCDPELYGTALAEIVAEWLAREVVRLSERKV